MSLADLFVFNFCKAGIMCDFFEASETGAAEGLLCMKTIPVYSSMSALLFEVCLPPRLLIEIEER